MFYVISMKEKSRRDYFLPLSIAISIVIVFGAVIYSVGKSQDSEVLKGSLSPMGEGRQGTSELINQDDHLLGNPNADLIIFEYSDFECPFCREFHKTRKKIIDEYGDRIAWVFRHFVLGMFPNSERVALARECSAEVGGKEMFWEFADAYLNSEEKFFLNADIQGAVNVLGLNVFDFNSCMESGRYLNKINSDTAKAKSVGGSGTPYSVVVDSDGSVVDVIVGAYPINEVRFIIEKALR